MFVPLEVSCSYICLLAMVRLDHHLPTLLPDQINDGMPFWDFALDTPIRWSDAHWNPGTTWLDPVSATSGSDHLNPLAAPFQPRSTAVVPNRPPKTFNPSRILPGQRRIISAPLLQLAHRMGYNLNGNYEGEIDEFAVRNANCPPDQNCSLFIVNVHVDVSAGEFFGLIREGPIFSFHRKLPQEGIDTCAVSLVFTTREAAEAFYYRCNNPGIRLYGRRFRAMWNRERVWPVPSGEAFQSRVVRITGPKDQVSGKGLLDFFGKFLSYTLSGAREKVEGNMRIVEIAFGSIRGQSRAAFKLFHLEVMNAPGGDVFSIEYAPDPCAGGMVELW